MADNNCADPVPAPPTTPSRPEIVHSVAEVRDRLRKQLEGLIESGKDAFEVIAGDGPRTWTKIDKGDWTGDLMDIEGIIKAFNRDPIAQDLKDSIKDPYVAGTVGDLMVSQLQGDYLATQQRAFLGRHSGQVRNLMHAAGRRRGHGHAGGVIQKGILGYLEDLIKKARDYT